METDDKELYDDPGWLDTLLHISLQYPVPCNDLRDLYRRHHDLVIVETIVHIAATNLMPLWSAEQQWVEWWQDNRQDDCPGELYRTTVVLDKDLDTLPVCFGMVVVAGKVVQAANVARWQVGRTIEQVREWVAQKGGTIERIESED